MTILAYPYNNNTKKIIKNKDYLKRKFIGIEDITLRNKNTIHVIFNDNYYETLNGSLVTVYNTNTISKNTISKNTSPILDKYNAVLTIDKIDSIDDVESFIETILDGFTEKKILITINGDKIAKSNLWNDNTNMLNNKLSYHLSN